jgi:hypothetical protein
MRPTETSCDGSSGVEWIKPLRQIAHREASIFGKITSPAAVMHAPFVGMVEMPAARNCFAVPPRFSQGL